MMDRFLAFTCTVSVNLKNGRLSDALALLNAMPQYDDAVVHQVVPRAGIIVGG